MSSACSFEVRSEEMDTILVQVKCQTPRGAGSECLGTKSNNLFLLISYEYQKREYVRIIRPQSVSCTYSTDVLLHVPTDERSQLVCYLCIYLCIL
jgi:hypothetical protein